MIPEGLIEELTQIIDDFYYAFVPERPTAVEERDWVELLITRIVRAIMDGEIKLPEEEK